MPVTLCIEGIIWAYEWIFKGVCIAKNTHKLQPYGREVDAGMIVGFDADDPSGTYRIVWSGALSSYDENGAPFGDVIPLKARISNRFALSR